MSDLKVYFQKYLNSISSKFAREETSEMGYRTDFEILLKNIFSDVKNTHILHDAKADNGNKPDFVVLKNDIPILYIEAKKIGVSLDKVEKSEQMKRYFGYANLILTDYVEFRFYRNGIRYENPINIARYDDKLKTINNLPANFEHLAKSIIDFTKSHKEPIKSGKHLSKIMGGKAQRIRDNIKEFLKKDSDKNKELNSVYKTIKQLLVHDLTKESFADMYAQTLVYGLFVARFNDKTPNNFTRQEARDLIPKSNPFLRHFFDHIVGPDFDKRLEYIVNELCEVFVHADVNKLMHQYYKTKDQEKENKGPDPVIHFYEDFLKEYDPELRKKLGAFYTPLPVVRFIIRAVDQILKKDFKLAGGLANTSKLKDGNHKVQILDPATGTGTFISAIIAKIYQKILKSGQKGRWPSYVHNDLLPRLHGFELMMAPYTIAHLKLSMAFQETGFKYFNQRLSIYLTNSLEGGTKQDDLFTGFGLAESIAEESKEADKIKSEKPIMVVMGNPPYSGESSNKHYSGNDVYKFEPTGEKLKERNPKWINDDYVKFIRFAESYIEKNETGVIGMITAHGYIDNPTFRGMRHHLMRTFDKIYILDLHGNANKKETALDGSKDENVFNIKTGTSIILAVKTDNKSEKLADIYKTDLFGKRIDKFEYLNNHNIDKIKWNHIKTIAPNYEWIEKDFEKFEIYNKGFSINELFIENGVGITTAHDNFVIKETKKELLDQFEDFQNSERNANLLHDKFNVKKKKGWNILDGYDNIKDEIGLEKYIQPISYRPFDNKYIFYEDKLVWRTVRKIMDNIINKNNIALLIKRQGKRDFSYIFLSKKITESCMFESAYANNTVCPLYTYNNEGDKQLNLNNEIVEKIENIVGLIEPENILDYIYAVLYSPKYRKKFKEFLKIDFPRVPYPKDKKQFNFLVKKGEKLRKLHLMESDKLEDFITTYPESGSDEIEKIKYEDNKVYINKTQYFGKVPEIAWNFYIGGYQPAQKWLKDRKGRKLNNEDIEHYQKIIKVLVETDKIMKRIDEDM